MGEYARFSGHEIKIGTCEDMYYLRYDQRHLVEWVRGNVDPVKQAGELRFRLPFPDEDGIEPGGFQDYNRSVPLFKRKPNGYPEFFSDEETLKEKPLIIQLRHESGLMANVPCYHGMKLPTGTDGVQFFFNGKDPGAFVLSSLRGLPEGGVAPVIRCKFCNNSWRYTWAEILPWVYDKPMRERLEKYAEQEQLAV